MEKYNSDPTLPTFLPNNKRSFFVRGTASICSRASQTCATPEKWLPRSAQPRCWTKSFLFGLFNWKHIICLEKDVPVFSSKISKRKWTKTVAAPGLEANSHSLARGQVWKVLRIFWAFRCGNKRTWTVSSTFNWTAWFQDRTKSQCQLGYVEPSWIGQWFWCSRWIKGLDILRSSHCTCFFSSFFNSSQATWECLVWMIRTGWFLPGVCEAAGDQLAIGPNGQYCENAAATCGVHIGVLEVVSATCLALRSSLLSAMVVAGKHRLRQHTFQPPLFHWDFIWVELNSYLPWFPSPNLTVLRGWPVVGGCLNGASRQTFLQLWQRPELGSFEFGGFCLDMFSDFIIVFFILKHISWHLWYHISMEIVIVL